MENVEYYSHVYCPICGSIMIHTESDGMMGWLCTDPDCAFFEPDPI